MKPIFTVKIYPKGLLSVINGKTYIPKEEYTKTNPDFFDCDCCKKEDALTFEVRKGTTGSFWVCSEICATALILREL